MFYTAYYYEGSSFVNMGNYNFPRQLAYSFNRGRYEGTYNCEVDLDYSQATRKLWQGEREGRSHMNQTGCSSEILILTL